MQPSAPGLTPAQPMKAAPELGPREVRPMSRAYIPWKNEVRRERVQVFATGEAGETKNDAAVTEKQP